MSTILAHVDKRPLPRRLFCGFAVFMAVWSTQRSFNVLVYLALLGLGFCYFGSTTALNTVLQQNLSPHNRPYVMSLWFMSFAGTIPIAGLWAGGLMESALGAQRGAMVVLLIGAAGALGLAWFGDLRSVAPDHSRATATAH